VSHFEPSLGTATDEITGEPGYHEAIVRALQDGLIVSRDGRIVDVNDRMGEMTGFTRGDLIGTEMPWAFIPRDNIERITALCQRLRDSGRVEYELELARADGSRFPVLASAGAAHGDDGEPMGWVFLVRDISDRKRRESRLTELAARDDLTGLLNRRSFLVHLAGEVARARRHGRPVSLAILDLDGFKGINDKQGHQAGDRVLAEVAGRLGALCRTGEHMARVGGDEFAWILPETDAQGAAAAVIRARIAIASEPFRGAGTLTLSAGICQNDGQIDAPQTHARADRALYSAKAAGGDTVWTH
jgi:diguanylate cyclase (GGDEF)-like protein/PAS domain S-box-containing protein